MSLKIGSVLSGAKWRYLLVARLGDHTVFSNVFKAEVLPGIQSKTPVKLYVLTLHMLDSSLILTSVP